MFKKSLALFSVFLFVILAASNVFAVRLIEPESKVLEGDDLVGKVYPGGTLELIFSKENGKYSEVNLLTALPEEYSFVVTEELEAFKIFITVPKEEVNWRNALSIEFLKAGSSGEKDIANVYFLVENELLSTSMNGFSKTTYANSPAGYEFVFVNKSDVDAVFSVSSSLSKEWFSKADVLVPKRSSKIELLLVNAPVQGKRQFDFIVDYSNKSSVFNSSINVLPTIFSKFNSAFYGLPFYSFSLFPSYLLNSLLSLLF
ncbi:MAG: hypothetical protein WC308_00560 [archaeon]|jgi:hypothetical protein